MSQYRKGYRRELEVMSIFEREHNCACIRSAGSRGTADLICGNGICVYVIQVKYGKRKQYVSHEELREFAHKFRAVPVIAERKPYQSWEFTYG